MKMDNLKALRNERGLRQVDVAEFLEIDRTTYVKYETGVSEPDIETLKKIAKFLGTSISYLVEETHDPTPMYIKEEAIPPIDSEEWLHRGLAARYKNLNSRQISVLLKNIDSIFNELNKAVPIHPAGIQ